MKSGCKELDDIPGTYNQFCCAKTFGALTTIYVTYFKYAAL